HGWRAIWGDRGENFVRTGFSWLVTLLAVVVGWVFFRAPNVETAFGVLKSMAGFNGWGSPTFTGLFTAVGLLAFAVVAPNSQQLMNYVGPESLNKNYTVEGKSGWFRWQPTLQWAIVAGTLFVMCLTRFSQISEFIYFQF